MDALPAGRAAAIVSLDSGLSYQPCMVVITAGEVDERDQDGNALLNLTIGMGDQDTIRLTVKRVHQTMV